MGPAHARGLASAARTAASVGALLVSCVVGLAGSLCLCVAGPGVGSRRCSRLTAHGVDAPGSRSAADTPSIRELVGQRFMVAMNGTTPSPALLGADRPG